MSIRTRRLSSLASVWLCAGALLVVSVRGRAQETEAPLPQTAGKKPAAPAIAPAEHPLKVPEGAARAGWELLLKNQFEEAEAAFRQVLAKDRADLTALEGLRSSLIARGEYGRAQTVNLQMVEVCGDPGLCAIFTSRAIDALEHVDGRQKALETFRAAAAKAQPALAGILGDSIATLLFRDDKPVEARQALLNSGYVNLWQFVAGPFGARDQNSRIERRFAPEYPLASLDFTDERNEPVKVLKDVSVPDRGLNLGARFHGRAGVCYALANLDSGSEQDVLLWTSLPVPCRVYLRGLPVLQEPGEEQFRRTGGGVVRVRLQKGSNPLLVKTDANGGHVSVRVSGLDYAPLKDVRCQALPAGELAAHQVNPVRGLLFSEKACGSIAAYFLKRFTPEERRAGKNLHSLITGGGLSFPEAVWLDFALQRENDVRAREVLAHIFAGSAPDSAAVLDLAAFMLQSAGGIMRNTEAREAEEARRLREHALAVVPGSHQHLLGLYYFFKEHQLPDQAFEKIKACVAAHPKSPLALCELGKMCEDKDFMIEAERCYEEAAALDNTYLGCLVWFHGHHGNRARARELFRRQIELGLARADQQFETALRQGDTETAGRILRDQEKANPDQSEELAEKHVRLLTEKGSFKEAFKLQSKLYAEMDARDSERHDRLLSLAELGLRANEDKAVHELLQAYLKDTPGDFAVRQRLQTLNSRQTRQWWEEYDIQASSIDTSEFTSQKYPNANHAWVVDFMVTRILPDLSRESCVHIAQKVLNQKGISELSELLVQAQRNHIIFIRTLNPDGSSFLPQNVHEFNLARSASLYKVGPGSILEHAYLEHLDASKDEPAFSMGFNFNAIDAPRAVSRWVVLIADEAKAKLEIRKIRPEMIEEKTLPGPPGYTVYQWTNKQVAGIKFEPLMPGANDQEVVPFVSIETPPQPFRTDGWLARRERDFVPPEAVEQARKIAAETPGGETAKFEALVRWVREKIQPGPDSRTLDDVWFSRTGSASQVTLLTREMAQSAGLNVHSAWVNVAYAPGRAWRSKTARRQWEPGQLAGFGSGGQLLVLEPDEGADRWIGFQGGAWPFYNPSELLAGQPGALAALMTDEGLRIKRVRGEELGQTLFQHRVAVELDAQGNAKVQGSIQLFGKPAGDVRESLSDPRRRAQLTEWFARSSWPKIQAPRSKIEHEDAFGLPLSVRYSGSITPLAAQAEGTFAFSPFLSRCRLLELRGPPERQHDMLLKGEFGELDQTLSYTAPEGCAWVEVPNDLFIVTEFGFYLADYNVRGRTLTCTRSYLVPAQRIAPERYADFIAFLKPIAGDSQQRIGYAPVKAESFGPARQEVLSTGYAACGDEKK